ncbi:hypothetical protein [Actinokineospora terrae]|uniref:Secreted protein n=1 Tax=Actinokineospora terrae TaxID=155974 RepID=A0A1H9RX49_9PSEU|nr:hypothetical protein [Actinokineospora terrae]SER76479.1 hypothetical protein SAMN04487818_105104 [Actinokineospora terrae]
MSSIKRFGVAALVIVAMATAVGQAVAEPGDKNGDRVEVAKQTDARPSKDAPLVPLVPDDGLDRPTGQGVGAQAVPLPFTFNFDFTSSLASRTFWPTSAGRTCVSLRGTGGSDPIYFGKEIKIEMWNAYGTDTKVGPTVRYSLNGNSYGYCWTGLYPYHEHYFRLVKDWSPTVRVWGTGWASAS